MDFKSRLIEYLQLTQEDSARLSREPSFDSIPRIDEEPSVKRAISLIRQTMEERKKIIVYGDYDTDGVMATSIIMRCFHKLHYAASFYLPTRYQDGYGLTMDNARKIADKGYSLVILVDNGVSCLDAVSFLLSRGIQTVIIDHHDLPSSLPPAAAIVHDQLLKYGQYPVCAGFLCFLFSVAWLGEVDDYLLTLAAISLIGDLMPIRGHNSEMVRLALRNIRANKYPEIMTMTDKSRIDETVLGMEIIPQINAVGRIVEDHTINRLVHYFADLDFKNKLPVAAFMRETNEARKTLTIEASAKITLDPFASANVVVANLKEGLNGLLANRLLSQNGLPTVVFSPANSDPDCYVGSLRCKDDLDVMVALESLSAYTVRFGGHPHAAGVTIKKKDYAIFREEFLRYVARNKGKGEKEREPMEIFLHECTMDSFRVIREFGPYGMDYREPRFILRNVPVDSFQYSMRSGCLLTPLPGGARLIGFKYHKEDFVDKQRADFVVRFGLNEFRGKVTLDIIAEKE